MSALVAIHEWLNQASEALDPAFMQYTTKEAQSCRGCLFERQRAAVCDKACELAVHAGLEHCEHGVIYIAREIDPRQLTIG